MRISGTSDSLLECADRLLYLALREGAEEAEVYGMIGRSVDIDMRKRAVELASQSFHHGLGLRAVVKGAVGFSSTSDMTRLEEVARSAVASSRARGPDESWCRFPEKEKVVHPEDIFDRTLQEIEPEECLDLAESMIEGCAGVKGVEPISGGVSCIYSMDFVVNSNGIRLQEISTHMNASMDAIAKGADVATGNEFHNSRMKVSTLEDVGRNAAELARASLSASKAESGSSIVLLKPLAFAELIQYTLIPALCADNVQKGRSSLKDSVDKKIASDSLQVVDDGLLAGGMDSSAFDGEGVPSGRNELIRKGVLTGFLYDSYTGGKAGLRSTGNAVRGGYSDIPRVGTRNVIIGSREAYDLSEETSGYLVYSLIGAHTANPISGDFSVEAKNCFFVKPGEKGMPKRSLMIAGNIFDLLHNIEIGTDVRAIGSIVTPTIKARLKVLGS